MKSFKVPLTHLDRKCSRVLEMRCAGRLAACQRWATPAKTILSRRPFSASSAICEDSRKPISKVLAFSELPQGLLDGNALPVEDESSAKQYPPVIQDARNNMQKFEHCVLLTRVGGFYELYFEQAEEYGPLLNIKVASKRTSVGPVPMAGFPFFQLERFLKILVQDLGRHVAISEEIDNDPIRQIKKGEPLDRQVNRVVTPGTLIDEQFLSPYNHNYLLAIDVGYVSDTDHIQGPTSDVGSPISSMDEDREIGLAWLDLSSGDFFTQSSSASTLSSDLARIGPKEIVIPKSLNNTSNEVIDGILKEDRIVISYFDPPGKEIPISDWVDVLEQHAPVEDAKKFTEEEISAVNILIQYVKKQLPGLKLRLQAPKRQRLAQFMSIDKNSLRGLEIHETIRYNAYKGSLIQAARRTSTESGARLLARRLTAPSTSLQEIQDRLDLVEHFLGQLSLLDRTTFQLNKTYDTLRLLQKFSFGKGDADDLLGLAQTIRVTRDISNLLGSSNERSSPCIRELLKRFHWDGPERIALQISEAIDEEGLSMRQRSQEDIEGARVAEMARSILNQEGADEPEDRLSKRLKSAKLTSRGQNSEDERVVSEDIWVMRRNASSTLGRLHDNLERLQQEKSELSNSLRERIGATSLSLKWTPGLGHICHVKGKDMRISLAAVEHARVVSSSKSTRSFYLPEWSTLGAKIESAKARIKGEEQNIFGQLRDSVIENLVLLRRNATVLDEVDVACSFARLANELGLKRPIVNHSLVHKVIGGRHLTVEAGLIETGRHFTPNQCMLNDEERIWLITGPNMAGKSTFLRQNALISILAQTGSFVPAEYAELGIVDQIFSRVGSADNLSQDQSTFMIEMLETAYILKHATSQSFVIMDEVGRGTTPEDGTAVAFAVLHHLHHVTRCRTLFATHFHSLADMTNDFERLATYCTNVIEEPNGAFRYDHRMRKGVNRESHALKVATLAGMPDETITLASKLLQELKVTDKWHGEGSTYRIEDKLKAQAG